MHLVLDLDETLIHVSVRAISRPDFKFTLDGVTYYGRKRPHLDLFLKYAFRHFDSVSVWTAATKKYAEHVLNAIMTEEQRGRLLFFLTRRNLTVSPEGYYKPLASMFRTQRAKQNGMKASNTIMVDDKADVLRDNIGNGILIPAWKAQAGDKYLSKMIIIMDGIFKNQLPMGHYESYLDLKYISG